MTESRRFPAPWTAAEIEKAFRIEDATGFAVAHVYFTDDPERRSSTGRMSKDEARRVAIRIAAMPAMQLALQEANDERDAALALAASWKTCT
ncbi:hypothetical protein [Methylobacterium planeticum]|uniref:Uncharacterized protein n=1 Tax=Methylobacterium planeticum TaxID=2615211 RepID=A0A6N6MD09_9HYPH|nr:hypothetical protein [Methylobacterium planeticum]KAB1067568.1 hypothetical protein F6X51_27525 [Methylobacterium planeticum]